MGTCAHWISGSLTLDSPQPSSLADCDGVVMITASEYASLNALLPPISQDNAVDLSMAIMLMVATVGVFKVLWKAGDTSEGEVD
jgi:hypothetical protein